MRYSYRIEQAIRAAAILHDGQRRRGTIPYPYITHPFAVSLIVGDYTDNEDVIIGALLHDTLEDSDYTAKELEDDFGASVRALVEEVTHPPSADESDAEWQRTKGHYVENLNHASEGALIIAAADKLHNMRSVIEEYHQNIKRFIGDFGGSLEERLIMYQKISNVINRRLQNPIVHEFNHVFDEYKKFIEHARKEEKN